MWFQRAARRLVVFYIAEALANGAPTLRVCACGGLRACCLAKGKYDVQYPRGEIFNSFSALCIAFCLLVRACICVCMCVCVDAYLWFTVCMVKGCGVVLARLRCGEVFTNRRCACSSLYHCIHPDGSRRRMRVAYDMEMRMEMSLPMPLSSRKRRFRVTAWM